MTNTLIILAGGASSRMKSSPVVEGLSEEEIQKANITSKALIEFGKGKRPLLDFLLLNAEKAGYTNIILVVGKDGKDFKNYYGPKDRNNSFNTLSISYAYQHIPEGRTKPWGTADAVQQAMDQYPDLKKSSFAVCNSDNLYSPNALQLLRECTVPMGLIAYDRDGLDFTEERIAKFAVLQIGPENHLTTIIEKPDSGVLSSFTDSKGKLRVSMNIWKFTGNEIYPYLKNCKPHPIRDHAGP